MDELRRALQEAGIETEEDTLQKLNAYQRLLLEWNGKMDLTSVSQADTAARHFLDSLLPLAVPGLFPENGKIIDVGSGAGFPGLPIAIARGDLAVTLLEAQGKRCQFLEAVCREVGLKNVSVLNERAEVAGRSESHREAYDRAVARAVAPLNLLCEYLLPFVKVGGAALCWKGPGAAQEMEDGEAAADILGGQMGESLDMGVQDRRHILIPIQKIEKTLPQYPRKNGIPAKRPLKSGKK